MIAQSTSPFSILIQKTGLSIKELATHLGYSERTLRRWENGQTSPRQSVIMTLENIIKQRTFNLVNPCDLEGDGFKFIDLFAGIGGLRRGFDAIGGTCVFTSEWNKYAQQTYAANYYDGNEHIMAGDITQVNAADIPAHDLLLAGFPCQPFSIAGVSKKKSLGKAHGFRCDAQGTLFFDVARIIEHHRPLAFLLENVKNLISHDKGNTFKVIRQTLAEDLGYHIDFKLIDAKGFVPQHRERIYIVGFREDCGFNFDDMAIPDPLSGPRMETILHSVNDHNYNDKHYTDARGRVSSKYTLTDKLWSYLQAYAEKHRAKGNGFGFGLVGPADVSRTLSARYYKDGSEILIKRRNGNPRRLTPRECARLMGFEKPGQSNFVIPVSDTQAYKQFGNAVVVPVVEEIARYMSPFILSGKARVRMHNTNL